MRATSKCGRRCVLTGAAGAMLLGRAAKASDDIFPHQSLTALHQAQLFGATPARLYEVFTTTRAFEDATGLPASIDPRPGGQCSLFGGQVLACNVELVQGKRLVQAWRASHWAPGVYSIVRFEFQPRGGNTLLTLDQAGFPAGAYDSLSIGWTIHYWGPLRVYLAP